MLGRINHNSLSNLNCKSQCVGILYSGVHLIRGGRVSEISDSGRVESGILFGAESGPSNIRVPEVGLARCPKVYIIQ